MTNVLKVLKVGSLVALLGVAPVQASTLIRVQDLRTDGADFRSGVVFGDDSRFEIYSLEAATVNGETVIRLDSNLPLAGVEDKRAADGHIGYGDLFIETAQGSYAIKFAPNGSTLPIGVYRNAVGVNLAAENNGAVDGRSNPRPTNLVAGERIGDVYVTSVAGSEGSGRHRLVIAFNEGLLPAGDRQLYFTQECHNDTVELAYSYLPSASATPAAPPAMIATSHLGPALASSQPAIAQSPPPEDVPSEVYIGAGVVGVAILLALLFGGDSDDSDRGSSSNLALEEAESSPEVSIPSPDNNSPGTDSPESASPNVPNATEPSPTASSPDDRAEPDASESPTPSDTDSEPSLTESPDGPDESDTSESAAPTTSETDAEPSPTISSPDDRAEPNASESPTTSDTDSEPSPTGSLPVPIVFPDGTEPEPGPLPALPSSPDIPSAAIPVPGLGGGWLAAGGLLLLAFRRLKSRH